MNRADLFALLLAVATGSGCQGPEGERGPQGIAGPTGPRGTQGAVGATGPPGTPGVTAFSGAAGAQAAVYRPVFFVACTAGLDLIGTGGVLGTDAIGETLLVYNVTIYSTDDVSVDCTVSTGSAASGSDSRFLPSVTTGAAVAACMASGDYPPYPPPPSNAGFWRFVVANSGPSVVYVDDDPGHPLNGFKHLFSEAECHAFALDDSLEWRDVTLGDVF